MRIEAVVFDVGEVLIDETGVWSRWADWLGVTRLTFMAMLGAELARGGSYRDVFPHFQPEFDLVRAWEQRKAAGDGEPFFASDLYPDVREGLTRLRQSGFRVAIAGNQPLAAERILADLKLPVEFIVASERWGVHKPAPAFFARVATELGLAPGSIAYVGDRVDNDVVPAKKAGMVSVFIRRGPWGYLQAGWPEAANADIRVDSLIEIAPALTAWNAVGGGRTVGGVK